MSFRLPNSKRGRQTVAYLSLLFVFWALMFLLLGLDVWVGISYGVFDTYWGGTLLIMACVFLAVFVAHGVGELSYIGVALVVFAGVSGLPYFIAVSMAGPGYALQVFEQLWRELLGPVGFAYIALLIIRQLTNH